MSVPRLLLSCMLSCAMLPSAVADLLPRLRVIDTIVEERRDSRIEAPRRIAIIETGQGGQRMVAEGEMLGACLVKRIRPMGIDLDCHGRARSLGIEGRSRSV